MTLEGRVYVSADGRAFPWNAVGNHEAPQGDRKR